MRSEKEIQDKLREIEAANKKRRRPNPERIDIIEGLGDVQKLGKYGTLHKWEERKKELKFMENFLGDPILKYGKRGMYGEVVPGEKMEQIAWKLGSYRWALQIDDPSQVVMQAVEYNRQKLKEKKKEKK